MPSRSMGPKRAKRAKKPRASTRQSSHLNKDTEDVVVSTHQSSGTSHVNEGAEEVGASTHQSSGRKRKATFEDAEDVNVSTHRSSERERKVRKLTPDTTTVHVEKNAGDVIATFNRTPATKRVAHHSSLIKIGEIYARDVELQLAAEARGVT